MRFLGFSLAVAAMFLCSNETRAQQNPTMPAAATASAIPFRLKSGFLIQVEGRIGQLKGLKFILDTGATHSVIDRRIARRFPLILSHKEVFNFDRFVGVDWAEFSDVYVGPIEVRNVSMMITDLGKASELAGDADAIIGLDLLTMAASIGIDYDSKSVMLRPRRLNTQTASGRGNPQCFTIEGFLQGYPVRLVLDTGIGSVVLYEDRIRKRIPNLSFKGEKRGDMGRLHGKTAWLTGFRLAGRESNTEVFLINGPQADQLSGIDGFIGTSFLRAKRIEVDFEGKTIRWQ
jgi:aspartyl protease